jgi:hypothetical protein
MYFQGLLKIILKTCLFAQVDVCIPVTSINLFSKLEIKKVSLAQNKVEIEAAGMEKNLLSISKTDEIRLRRVLSNSGYYKTTANKILAGINIAVEHFCL